TRVETGGAGIPGRLADGIGGGAGGIPLPGRHAGDDSTDDRSQAGDVLVALDVSEAGAAGLPLPPVPVGARAVGADAFVGAGARAATTAPTAIGRVTVHVVAGVAVAVVGARTRVFGSPPSAHHGAGWAGVDPGHRAAEPVPPADAAASSGRAGSMCAPLIQHILARP